MPIRGVIFDGFSTLFSAPNLFCGKEVSVRLVKFGYSVDPVEIDKGISKFWVLAEKGEIGDFVRWRDILHTFGRIHEPSDEAIFECILTEAEVVMRDCRPFPAMRQTLQQIRKILPIALCSNASPIHLSLEERLNLRDLFGRGFTVSCEVYLNKSQPGIFLRAASNIGLEPMFCLYVDDGPEHLGRAKAMGMTTVLAVQGEVHERVDESDERADYVIHALPEIITTVLPACGVNI